MRSGLLLGVVLLFSACTTYADRPTSEMVAYELTKPKKLVTFLSPSSPEILVQRALESGCGKDRQTHNSVVPTGSGFAGVSSTYDFSVEHGPLPDGSTWLAIRVDGIFHGSPAGYRMKPTDDGSEVTVYAANPKLAAEIQQHVEAGRLFCDWRKYNYPYD